jgi:hypothetical protein
MIKQTITLHGDARTSLILCAEALHSITETMFEGRYSKERAEEIKAEIQRILLAKLKDKNTNVELEIELEEDSISRVFVNINGETIWSSSYHLRIDGISQSDWLQLRKV